MAGISKKCVKKDWCNDRLEYWNIDKSSNPVRYNKIKCCKRYLFFLPRKLQKKNQTTNNILNSRCQGFIFLIFSV